MKFLTPKRLHKIIIKDHYDIEISYLESSCARVIGVCPDISTKLISWILVMDEVVCEAEYQVDCPTGTMWKQYLQNPCGFAFFTKSGNEVSDK